MARNDAAPPAARHPVGTAHAGIARDLLTGLDAVLRGCLPGQPERLAALDAAIRAPLPLSTGVGVVGAGDAAPTGVVAGLLAGVLAARRPHRVLTVAAGARRAEPAGSRRAQPALDEAAIARRATARTGGEATAGLDRAPSGAWSLELDAAARWWDAVAPITRFFDFVVTDWDTPPTLDDARAASGILLVVARATREGLSAGVGLRARLAGPGATVVLALLADGGAPRGLAEAARVNGARWVPADKGLDGLDQRGRGLDEPDRRPGGLDGLDQPGRSADQPTPRLRYATTTAVLELAARVVTAAATRNRTEAAA